MYQNHPLILPVTMVMLLDKTSTLLSSMSSGRFWHNPTGCLNSAGNLQEWYECTIPLDSHGSPVEFEWNFCGLLVELLFFTMTIKLFPMEFQQTFIGILMESHRFHQESFLEALGFQPLPSQFLGKKWEFPWKWKPKWLRLQFHVPQNSDFPVGIQWNPQELMEESKAKTKIRKTQNTHSLQAP